MAIPRSGRTAPSTMAQSSSTVDSPDSATPHSSTVATATARRRTHTAGSTSRVLQQHYPPKEIDTPVAERSASPFIPTGLAVRAPIVIRPSGRPGFSAPKAATFFLGKDHERWRQYDRERFSGLFSWERVASAISSHGRSHRGSRGAFSSYSSGSDDDRSDSGNSHRSSRSRSSRYSGSRRPSEAATPPMTPFDSANPSLRPRRFSSNGPEAAFQRHETVIGIHTPRRRSSASSDSLPFLRPLAQIHPPASGTSSSVDVSEPGSTDVDVTAEAQKRPKKVKHSNEQRMSSKKDKKPTKSHTTKTRTKHKDAPVPNKAGPHGILDLDDAARPHLRRLRSNLQEAAAAAAASTEASPAIEEAEDALEDAMGMHVSLSDAALDGKGPLSAQDLRSLLPADHRTSTPRSPLGRGISPRAPPLKLAKRLQPQKVEGTLYDKTGPYREGAVSDGLSVRLFSAEPEPRTSSFEDADLSNSEHPVTKPWGRRGSNSSHDGGDEDAVFMQSSRRRSNSSADDNRRLSPKPSFTDAAQASSDSAVDDSSSEVFLITTPDNRVSSAAKLRRWAMDGAGNFYAAMEIKSIEAKLRAADPSAGRVTRELTKELEETYLDDILDEVQKAQTLNPTRSGAVSKILRTEDDRYIRLEEDYPEEAFFVIAGCEEAELNGVIINIFVQAIRTLARFHASGWMHGDVKLENLMFDENGELVVIDYENANPYRGIPGGDGQVQLVSYDWIPPEACPGPMGRRMGPSGDLWALGCNLIRAFALRDGVEDASIRETLLGTGQKAFLEKMSRLVSKKESTANGPKNDYFAPKSEDDEQDGGAGGGRRVAGMPWDIFAYSVDLEPILNDTLDSVDQDPATWTEPCIPDDASSTSTANTPDTSIAPSSGHASPKLNTPLTPSYPLRDPLPTPTRLLYRFARSAPELLHFVLSRCVVPSPASRNIAQAEAEALQLADWLESNRKQMLEVGRKAVEAAIEMSGSVWVRPRLDDARKSLGLQV